MIPNRHLNIKIDFFFLYLFSDFDQLDPHDIKINNKKVRTWLQLHTMSITLVNDGSCGL